jgi:hypothetical protein
MSGARHRRSSATHTPTELELHRAVATHLRQRGVPQLLWFHVPNGGRRDHVTASILQGMGTLAGASDLILLHQGGAYALELKTEDGKPSAAQIAFAEDFTKAGGCASIAYGLDQALRTLETWGLLRGNTNMPTQAQRLSVKAAA